MKLDLKDALSGGFFILCGVVVAFDATIHMKLGTALRMGPGYFPTMLGIILIVVGLAVAIRSIGKTGTPLGETPWRAVILISIAPVLFGLTVRGLGLVPATALAAFTSSIASRQTSAVLAGIITIGLTLFCTLVFKYGLGIPLRLFGPWLGA